MCASTVTKPDPHSPNCVDLHTIETVWNFDLFLFLQIWFIFLLVTVVQNQKESEHGNRADGNGTKITTWLTDQALKRDFKIEN